jgi:hypothetical protein
MSCKDEMGIANDETGGIDMRGSRNAVEIDRQTNMFSRGLLTTQS